MAHYKYSIIIPHKNTLSLLQRCLDSIPIRSDIQIIVVDDNSCLSNEDKVKFPGSDRDNVEVLFLHEEGRGAGYARNKGMEKASGIWLLFSDADDMYSPNAFDILDANLNDDVDVLYFNAIGQIENPDARGNVFYRKYNKLYDKGDYELIKYAFWAPWNKVSRRQFVNKNELQYEERPVGNDMMFNLRLGQKSIRCAFIKDPLYILTDVSNSISFRKKTYDEEKNRLELLINQDRFYVEHGLNDLRRPLFVPSKLRSIYKMYGRESIKDYMKTIFEYQPKLKAFSFYVVWRLQLMMGREEIII